MKDRGLVCDCWIRLMWIPACLQRADSTRGDPHQPLTFFGLNTHAWTVSRDIKMEKWMGRRVGSALLGEAEQDWGVPAGGHRRQEHGKRSVPEGEWVAPPSRHPGILSPTLNTEQP